MRIRGSGRIVISSRITRSANWQLRDHTADLLLAAGLDPATLDGGWPS
jgi:hypothetical protein